MSLDEFHDAVKSLPASRIPVMGKTSTWKSHLIYALLGDDRVAPFGEAVGITTEIKEITKPGIASRFVDTPGIQDEKSHEQMATIRGRLWTKSHRSILLITIIHESTRPRKWDFHMTAVAIACQIPMIVMITKSQGRTEANESFVSAA
jgi:GTP-binding protein EngB required for normal cell division